jgi:hypothetical protein
VGFGSEEDITKTNKRKEFEIKVFRSMKEIQHSFNLEVTDASEGNDCAEI